MKSRHRNFSNETQMNIRAAGNSCAISGTMSGKQVPPKRWLACGFGIGTRGIHGGSIQLKFEVNSAIIPERKPAVTWAGTARTSNVLSSKPRVPLAVPAAKPPSGEI